MEPHVLEYMVELAQGDARVALNNLEAAVYYASGGRDEAPVRLDLKTTEAALQKSHTIRTGKNTIT